MWNAFNEDNRKSMLFSVRHKWPSGAQFTFNNYHHWATLVVHDTEDGPGHFLYRKEGVIQGEPLATIANNIGVLPLIRELWEENPPVTHPCYADDAGARGGGVRADPGPL